MDRSSHSFGFSDDRYLIIIITKESQGEQGKQGGGKGKNVTDHASSKERGPIVTNTTQ